MRLRLPGWGCRADYSKSSFHRVWVAMGRSLRSSYLNTSLDVSLDKFCTTGAREAFGDLDLVDLNVVLHRADGGNERVKSSTYA